MIGKVIGGKSFAGTVEYVMKQDAKILDSEGITPPEVRDMVQDFSDQALLNPRVKNTVGHISLSFSEQDKAKLTDKFMVDVAGYTDKIDPHSPGQNDPSELMMAKC